MNQSITLVLIRTCIVYCTKQTEACDPVLSVCSISNKCQSNYNGHFAIAILRHDHLPHLRRSHAFEVTFTITFVLIFALTFTLTLCLIIIVVPVRSLSHTHKSSLIVSSDCSLSLPTLLALFRPTISTRCLLHRVPLLWALRRTRPFANAR